jgi:hypothetical protein
MTFVAFMTYHSSNLRPELTCAHKKSSKRGVFVIKPKTTQRFPSMKNTVFIYLLIFGKRFSRIFRGRYIDHHN